MKQVLKSSMGHKAIALFVMVFWVMNALEKFQILGKDRLAQMAMYLAAFGLGATLVPWILGFFGLLQGSAAVCAALALLKGPGKGYLTTALFLSVVQFGIFAVGDVIAVQRDQLLTHTIYATMFMLQFVAALAWQKFPPGGGKSLPQEV